MRYLSDPAVRLEDPRWICPNGHDAPYREDRGFPVCHCGRRMHFIDSPELPYVSTPQRQRERRQRDHEQRWQAYREWLNEFKWMSDVLNSDPRAVWDSLDEASRNCNEAAERVDELR